MKQLRYRGTFRSRSGVAWAVELLQEASQAFPTVGELLFNGQEPLTIEWARTDKEEVICGSCATLQIISPGDRTYQDLYTIEVGSVRMDVYRNATLYWSGMIDPEFYEEPYESTDSYVVQLTFSDFGILLRKKYALSGMQTLRGVVEHCLSESGLNYTRIDTSLVSSSVDGENVAGDALRVRSDNFFDEQGEAMTLSEVLEGILQPLALRIVQNCGAVFIYDLNGLYGSIPRPIRWNGSSQVMGTDKVANNIRISLSPYSKATLFAESDLAYGGKYNAALDNLTSDNPSDEEYGDYFSYYPDYSGASGSWDWRNIDFTIFLHQSGSGLRQIGGGCKYFHILPVSGPECSGVAYAFRTGGHGSLASGFPQWKLHSSVPRAGSSLVLETKRAFIPKISAEQMRGFRIRLTQELLLDARYNPLSGSESENDEGNDEQLKICSAFVFIPACVTLYDTAGIALYHYKNRDVAAGSSIGMISLAQGEWVEGADPGGHCYLEYYKTDDLKEDAGIRGWKKNRHCIGRPDGVDGRVAAKFYDSFTKMADGQYMPYPPAAGYLEVRIMAGVYGYDYGHSCAFGSYGSRWDESGLYSKLRWCLYKAPTVEIVNNNLVFDTAELDDCDYCGQLNAAAKESISIETICGTCERVCPSAKGIYYKSSDGSQLYSITRAGRTDAPEKLLIGTLYSQFASRKTTLRGDALIEGSGLHSYTEAMQESSKRFMMTAEFQDVVEDNTEAEFCEFAPDEYDSVNYE